MIPSLWASSTDSTARAAVLVGGREIGDPEGKSVDGAGLIGAEVGVFVGSFVGSLDGCLVTDIEGLFVDAPVPVVVVVEDVAWVVVPPTSVYGESQ